MEQFRSHGGVECLRALLDQPQPQMDMTKQSPLFRRPERWSASKLPDSADIVQERRGEQEVGAKPRMELGGLAGERRHTNGVMEQAARIVVVGLGCGERAERSSNLLVVHETADDGTQARVGDLVGQELEEAVELVGVAAQRGRQVARVGIGRLDRAHVELEPLAELRDAAEDAHRIAFREAPVEQLDVVPDPRFDPAGRIDELERQIRGALLRPQPLLARDRIDAFDDAILRELRDAADELSLGGR